MDDEQMSLQDKEIYDTLEYFDKIKTLKNIQSSQKSNIKKKLKTFLKFTNKIIKLNNLEVSLKCLNIFQKLHQKLDFSNIIDNKTIEIILNYNISCSYQIVWSTKERIFYLKKTMKNLEIYLNNICNKSSELSITTAYRYLKIKIFYLLVLLQVTAVYSTEKKHFKAQESANKALVIVDEIFFYYKKLFVFLEKDLELEKSDRFSSFFDNFQKILEIIVNAKNNINYNKINILKFINWKHTPENNKKLFGSYCKDLFQSKKFTAEWIYNFNIGDVMHLSPINLDLFQNNLPQNLFKNDDYILKLIIYSSTACYSLSTEKRYLAFEEIKYNPEKLKKKNKFSKTKKIFNDNLNEYKKKSSLKKNQNFIQSEFFHLKSIEILQNFVENFTLANYIQDNYKQSYSNMLNFITEEEEHSQSYSNLIKSGSKNKKNDSYYDDSSSKNIIINNITITKTNCNIMNNHSFEKNQQKIQKLKKNNLENNFIKNNNIDKNFLNNIYKHKFKNDEDILFSKFSIQEESVDFSEENLILNTNDKMNFKNKKEIIKNLFPSSKENTSSEYNLNPKLNFKNIKIKKKIDLKSKNKIDICFNYNFNKDENESEKKKKLKSSNLDKIQKNNFFMNDEIKNKFLKTMKEKSFKIKEKRKILKNSKNQKKKYKSKNNLNKKEKEGSKKKKRKKLKNQISLDIKLKKKQNLLKSDFRTNSKKRSPEKMSIKKLKEFKIKDFYKKKLKKKNKSNKSKKKFEKKDLITKEKFYPKNDNCLNILNKFQTIDLTYKNILNKKDKFLNIKIPLKLKFINNENDDNYIKGLNSERDIGVHSRKKIRPLTSRKKTKSGIFDFKKIKKNSFLKKKKKNTKKIFSPRIRNVSSFVGKSFNSLKWNSNILSYLNKKKH